MIQFYFELIKYSTKTFVVRPYKTNEFFIYNPSSNMYILLQIVSEKLKYNSCHLGSLSSKKT
jgi:hypothetical protein